MENDYLTKEELIEAYDMCSNVLHACNPVAEIDPIQTIRPYIAERIPKLIQLLKIHSIKLVDSENIWLVVVEDDKESPVKASIYSPVAQED